MKYARATLPLLLLPMFTMIGCASAPEGGDGPAEDDIVTSAQLKKLKSCKRKSDCAEELAAAKSTIESKIKSGASGDGWVVDTGICVYAAGGGGVESCADYAWSFSHNQAAGFSVVAGKLGLGIGASKYVGVAKAKSVGRNVVELWSGRFNQAGTGISWGYFSAGGQYFNSPDGNVKGGLLSVGVGLSLPGSPSGLKSLAANLNVDFSCYEPWDEYTSKFGKPTGTGRYSSSDCGSGSGKYIQFGSSWSMYLNMVQYGLMEVPALVAALLETAFK